MTLRAAARLPGPLAVLALCAGGAAAGAEESSIALRASSPAQACEFEGRQQDEPLPILIEAAPSDLADPSFLEPLADCAATRHLEILVRLIPPTEWLAAPDPYAAIGGWLKDLDRFLQARHGAVRAFQLGRRPDLVFEPASYAFLVEKVGTLLKSLDPTATLVIGPLGESSGDWLDRLDARRIAPYIHGLALEEPVTLAIWMPRLARDYAGMPVWLHGGAAGPAAADPAAAVRRYHEARSAGIRIVFRDATGPDAAAQAMINLYRALPPRFVVDLAGEEAAPAALSGPEESAALAAAAAPVAPPLRFADPLGPERAVVLAAAADFTVPAAPESIRNVRAFDLATGAELSTTMAAAGPADAGGGTRVQVAGATGPALVRYVVVREPRPAPEAVAVTEERELTAEEIVAGERAFGAAQARVMDHYETSASIAYHYRAETLGEAIDVATKNRFYWKGGTGDYEETELFINGARWHGKPPSLPFIQAEKVKEVPLEIRLDQSYSYRLAGKETVQGRPAWLIAFEPTQKDTALYSGEVWIDRESFARLKIRLVQHALKPPVTSNMDVIEYGPVPGRTADGSADHTFWLPVSGYRQMVFTVLGREVAAERTVKYEDFSVNAPAFGDRFDAALASGALILRDDSAGSSYLEREGDTIRVRRAESLENVAFFGGGNINGDASLGTPFAGVNYFNFNWRNTGTQMDVAFAGPLVDVAWTDPALGGSRWELTLDGRFLGVKESFHGTNTTGAVEEEDLKLLEERGLLVLAHPISPFQKAALQIELDADAYSRDASTDPNFVLPASGLTGIGTADWNYHRNGYKLDLWFSHGHRFSWADWGVLDPNARTATGAPMARGSAADTDFDRWGMTVLKSFYPGKLQNISLGLSAFDGANLDRFSRFRIGDFRNARVRGFSSKDLTFDRGVTAQVDYKFTLKGGGASMEIGFEGGVIENSDDFFGREYVLGGGAAVSISGPWSTLLSFRTSFGLASSLDVSVGAPSLRIVMIKTMDHWPRRHRPAAESKGEEPPPAP